MRVTPLPVLGPFISRQPLFLFQGKIPPTILNYETSAFGTNANTDLKIGGMLILCL